MASNDRMSSDDVSLLARLHDKPYEFDFFQALRYLENIYKDHPRTGTSHRASDDPVRFGQTASLGFAPSTISSFQHADSQSHPRLNVRFLGLFGPNGPLPLHLTDFAYSREANLRDHTFTRFADLFHHRILSIFYRAWAVAQPTVQYDRPDSDRFSEYVASLVGLGMPTLRDRDRVPDECKLAFSGHFACQQRHSEGLESILSGYFGVAIRIQQFHGRWRRLSANDRLQLGGRNPKRLGRNSIVGDSVLDFQQSIRIIAGPLRYEQFEELLPNKVDFQKLSDLIRLYTNDQWSWELQLILSREHVPAVRLGQNGLLGWNTWLGDSERIGDADDVTLGSRPK